MKAEADATRIAATKELLIKSMEMHKGDITNTCASCKISRETFFEIAATTFLKSVWKYRSGDKQNRHSSLLRRV
jgi:biotin synthase-related radical SAM superfamily protein